MRVVLLLLTVVPFVTFATPPVPQNSAKAVELYSLATREAQHRALLAMPSVDVEYTEMGRVRRVDGATGLRIARTVQLRPGDSAASIMRQLRPILMASDVDGLRVQHIQDRAALAPGYNIFGHYIFMEQTILGLPVVDAQVNVQTNGNDEIEFIGSTLVPSNGVSRTPALTFNAVKKKVREDLVVGELAAEGSVSLGTQGSLAYWSDEGKLERPQLVWVFEAHYRTPDGSQESALISADSSTGDVRRLVPQQFALNRTMYDLQGAAQYNATWHPYGTEGFPNQGDPLAMAAYNNVVWPRNLWAPTGHGFETLNIVMHWGAADNALFWAPPNVGYSIILGDLVAGQIDAVAHEYGHGVFLSAAPLQPTAWFAEWGAGNEFFADLSAVLVDLDGRPGGQPANPETWQISYVNVGGVNKPLRDLSNPKNANLYKKDEKRPQDWHPTRTWCCPKTRAHNNATIFGHALYLMRQGGVHNRVGQFWFNYVGVSGLIPLIPVQPINDNQLLKTIFINALYQMKLNGVYVEGTTLKSYTVAQATLFGGPVVAQSVQDAWTAVGIGYGCTAPPPVPAPDVNSEYCMGRYTMNWPQQPGVWYHGMVVPQNLSWDVFGITATDGQVNTCSTDLSGPARYHMRACNGCGCSAWSQEEWLTYYKPCL